MARQQTSLLKYHLIFVGCYVAGSVVTNLVASSLKVTGALGLVVILLSAFAAMRAFHKDHDRGMDRGERVRMLRTGVLVLTILAFLGLLIMKAAFEAQPINALFGRKFPSWLVLVGTLAAMAMSALQLWIVYFLLNGRLFPDGDEADGPASAAAAAPAPVRTKLRVLVLGADAAAHALAWKFAQSPRVLEVLVSPGNAGTAAESKCRNVGGASADVDALVALVRRESVDLTVACQPALLAGGLVDRFRALELRVLGPRAASASLADPGVARGFLARHGIPAATESAPGARIDALYLLDGRQAVLLSSREAAAGGGDLAPAAGLPGALANRIERELLEPMLRGLAADSLGWQGFLGLGVQVDADGAPRVAQIRPWPAGPDLPLAMMRLQSDIAGLAEAAQEGRAAQLGARTNPNPCLAIARTAGNDEIGRPVGGLDRRPPLEVKVFHAGTRQQPGRIEITGADVLTVCALGTREVECRMSADEVLGRIAWETPGEAAPFGVA